MSQIRIVSLFIAGLIAATLLLVACKRPPDFLYTPNKPPEADVTKRKQVDQQLKGLDGGVSGHVDFIWVVGGMVERQQDFYRGGAAFMTDFAAKAGLSWRMAVLGSDPYSAPEMGMNPLFTDKDPNPVQAFSRAISHVLQTIDSENIFDPVVRFIKFNPGFLRPEASLAVIISNDDPNRAMTTPTQFLNTLASAKGGDLTNVSINGIFGATDLGCALWDMDSDWNYHGSDYEKVIQATGGNGYSLCGPSFGSSLAQIGGNVVQRIASNLKIRLPTRPDPNRIVVTYHNKILPPGPEQSGGFWYYDFNDNAVGFYNRNFMNGATDNVHIAYEDM